MERIPRTLVLVVSADAARKRRSYQAARRAIDREGLHIRETIHVHDTGRLQALIACPESERPLFVAAGGDGTVGAVVDCLAGTEAVLGILPLGTSNDVARSLGISTRVADAVHLLTAGKVSTIDVGQFVADGSRPRHFIHAATIGLNVAFARLATQPSLRKRLGRFTYAVAGILALRQLRPFDCELELDGRRVSLCLLHLSIINAPVFGGRFAFSIPGASVDDRKLDILAIDNMSLLRIVLETVFLLLRRRPNLPGVLLQHVGRMRIHTEHPQPVTLDGEVAGKLPGDFVLVGEGLRVVTPIDFLDVDD